MENDDLKTENETLKQRVNELETRLKNIQIQPEIKNITTKIKRK